MLESSFHSDYVMQLPGYLVLYRALLRVFGWTSSSAGLPWLSGFLATVKGLLIDQDLDRQMICLKL